MKHLKAKTRTLVRDRCVDKVFSSEPFPHPDKNAAICIELIPKLAYHLWSSVDWVIYDNVLKHISDNLKQNKIL
jgi:hypothetical protein